MNETSNFGISYITHNKMSSKEDEAVEETQWNCMEDWLLSMDKMLESIQMPPTDVPAFNKSSSQKFDAESNAKRRGSYFSDADSDRDLVFAFCTSENVNILTDVFDRLRKLAQNRPEVFLKHQNDAVQRVRSLWEQDHKEKKSRNRFKSAGDMFAFATSGFKTGRGLQSENVGATLKLDSAVLNFDSKQIGETCEGTIQLFSKSITKCSFNVNHVPSGVSMDSYNITVSPQSGAKISVDSPCEISVKCRIDTSNTVLRELLVLEFDRSSDASVRRTIKRLGAFVSMSTGKAVFGVPYNDLKLNDKTGVPQVLELCKSELFKSGGVDVVGIFRKAAEKQRMDIMKVEMNRSTYKPMAPHADVNCMANLIKIWFREMSSPILSMSSSEDVLKLESADQCVALCKRIQEPNRTLLLWCVDMFVSVARNADKNKMNAKNCAIVMAPNFVGRDKTDPTSGGMKAIMMLQKAVFFLGKLIECRLKGMDI